VTVSTSPKLSIQNCTTPARQNNMYYLIDKGLDLGIIAVASKAICCLKLLIEAKVPANRHEETNFL